MDADDDGYGEAALLKLVSTVAALVWTTTCLLFSFFNRQIIRHAPKTIDRRTERRPTVLFETGVASVGVEASAWRAAASVGGGGC